MGTKAKAVICRENNKPVVVEEINNVFDTLYETYGYSYYDDWPARPFSFYWPGPTRSFFLSLTTVL